MQQKQVLVEVSARHVHLDAATVELLFGAGTRLTQKRELSQPGQFLSDQRVDLIGPKGTFKNVAVLGPERSASQIEISVTDSFALGVAAQVRESGLIDNTSGIIIKGPCGQITLEQGVIAAKRHIHMAPEYAQAFGLVDKQIVSVAVQTARPLVFGDVVVRVHPSYALSMHVDTDEANAALIPREGTTGIILTE